MPFADFNALKLPPGNEHEDDFALLADIFPTVCVFLHFKNLCYNCSICTGLAWRRTFGL